MNIVGKRKYLMAQVFQVTTFVEIVAVIFAVIMGHASGWDAAGIASLITAKAGGVGWIAYQNVREHEISGRGA